MEQNNGQWLNGERGRHDAHTHPHSTNQSQAFIIISYFSGKQSAHFRAISLTVGVEGDAEGGCGRQVDDGVVLNIVRRPARNKQE